jgi:hypothetical protein
MTIDGWLGLQWEDSGQPLIEPPRFSPVVADPSFLFPEESPDGQWALFAHSAWGVHRYSSSDGVAWADQGLVVWHAMRPFVRNLIPGSAEDGQARYILLYEKYPTLALPLTALPFKRPWRSVLAMQESSDLRSWSKPRILLEPRLSWMRDKLLGQAVSNPCLVENRAAIPPAVPQSDPPTDPPAMATAWRLYFSAGLSYIEDCGFNEPKYIGVATGPGPDGPFMYLTDPLLGPGIASGNKAEHGARLGTITTTDQNTSPELGAGSMKVIRLDDGWLGLQNRIYRDGEPDGGCGDGRSRSAIFVLRSEDGLSWRPVMDLPLIAPDPGNGWRSSHVYACDCRFREADGRWYLYFNARDGWRISEGRERIGRLVSQPVSGT